MTDVRYEVEKAYDQVLDKVRHWYEAYPLAPTTAQLLASKIEDMKREHLQRVEENRDHY